MKVFLCGDGVPTETILPYLSKRFDGNNVCHYTDENVNDPKTWPYRPDLIISVYYKTIIKPHVIETVDGKIFNAHTSLLPRHRGRSPIPWAIVSGDSHTGVTFHYIDQGIDTGNIILQAAVKIDESETQTSLFWKVNQSVSDYFPIALEAVLMGQPGVKPRGRGNYNRAGVPYGGKIDPDWPNDKIERFIRAMTYPPLPYATLNGVEIKSFGQYETELAYQHAQRRHSVTVQGSARVY